MKVTSSAILLLVAALSTLSATKALITQASVKPMIVKPGGLVTVSYEWVFSEDARRKLMGSGWSSYRIWCDATAAEEWSIEAAQSVAFNKNWTKSGNSKTGNTKPGGKLDLLFADGDITLRSASIKLQAWRPKLAADTSDLEENGVVAFDVPVDEIKPLKTYTAIFKFRLNDDWDSGEIVRFTVFSLAANVDDSVINVAVDLVKPAW